MTEYAVTIKELQKIQEALRELRRQVARTKRMVDAIKVREAR